MLSTTVKYYDGISSMPQDANLAFNENNNLLVITLPHGEIINVFCKDAKIEQPNNKNSLKIQFHKNNPAYLKVDDEAFIRKFYTYLDKSGEISWYQRLLDLGTFSHIAIAGCVMGLIALIYFYVIPFIAESAVSILPKEYDTQMGDLVYSQMVENEDIDSIKSKQLNEFASYLDLNNDRKLNFTVVKSPIVNAFALPNGQIVVYTGILNKMQDYSELVGLIGHEASHVNKRHSMKMMCRNLSSYLIISAILGDANGMMAIISENARNLESLSYSRHFEKEADTEGLKIVVKNKVNPNGMLELFNRLMEANDNLEIPEFLSSHPITSDRKNYITKEIKKIKTEIKTDEEMKSIFKQLTLYDSTERDFLEKIKESVFSDDDEVKNSIPSKKDKSKEIIPNDSLEQEAVFIGE